MMTIAQTTVDQIRNFFSGSPKAERLVDVFMAEQEEATQAERAALAATHKRLTAELEATHVARVAPRAQEIADIERCLAAVEVARATHGQNERAWREPVYDIERQRDQAEGRLRWIVADAIEALVRAAFEERQRIWAQRDDVVAPTIDGRSRLMWSNVDSLTARDEALATLIHDIRTWHLTGEGATELQARYDARYAALPAITVRPAHLGYHGQ